MQSDEAHHSAAHSPENVAAPIGADEAAQALKHGARGAFVVAGIAAGLRDAPKRASGDCACGVTAARKRVERKRFRETPGIHWR
jgi:hypothetical protein